MKTRTRKTKSNLKSRKKSKRRSRRSNRNGVLSLAPALIIETLAVVIILGLFFGMRADTPETSQSHGDWGDNQEQLVGHFHDPNPIYASTRELVQNFRSH